MMPLRSYRLFVCRPPCPFSRKASSSQVKLAIPFLSIASNLVNEPLAFFLQSTHWSRIRSLTPVRPFLRVKSPHNSRRFRPPNASQPAPPPPYSLKPSTPNSSCSARSNYSGVFLNEKNRNGGCSFPSANTPALDYGGRRKIEFPLPFWD